MKKIVLDALDAGYIPVVIFGSRRGKQTIPATISMQIRRQKKLAVALKAKKLILLTDVCGLMSTPGDASSLILIESIGGSAPGEIQCDFRRYDSQGGLLRGGNTPGRRTRKYSGWPYPTFASHRNFEPGWRGNDVFIKDIVS